MPLGGRAFEIVEVLAQFSGELVTRDELIGRIWPGATVLENTLQVHATAIRKALGPYRGLLKTEAGRGYRLLGDWTVRRHDPAGLPVGLQALRVPTNAPASNFPARVRLVGREAAIQQLRDLVSAYPVVTLTEPGGIGKTTLALEVARSVLGEFEDGGRLVEPASLLDPRACRRRWPVGWNSSCPVKTSPPNRLHGRSAPGSSCCYCTTANMSSIQQRPWRRRSFGCARMLR